MKVWEEEIGTTKNTANAETRTSSFVEKINQLEDGRLIQKLEKISREEIW